MKKILLITFLIFLGGCANKKPNLCATQIVEGKSIVIPPEFDVLPESADSTQE